MFQLQAGVLPFLYRFQRGEAAVGIEPVARRHGLHAQGLVVEDARHQGQVAGAQHAHCLDQLAAAIGIVEIGEEHHQAAVMDQLADFHDGGQGVGLLALRAQFFQAGAQGAQTQVAALLARHMDDAVGKVDQADGVAIEEGLFGKARGDVGVVAEARHEPGLHGAGAARVHGDDHFQVLILGHQAYRGTPAARRGLPVDAVQGIAGLVVAQAEQFLAAARGEAVGFAASLLAGKIEFMFVQAVGDDPRLGGHAEVTRPPGKAEAAAHTRAYRVEPEDAGLHRRQ